jgi:hypothetical protein
MFRPELDFKQSSLCHIVQVLQSRVLNIFSRSPLYRPAVFPLPLSVSGETVDLRTFLRVLAIFDGDTSQPITAQISVALSVRLPCPDVIRHRAL